MKLLITGPLGHIGSRLIHDLRPGEFEEVVLVDNLSTQRYCSLFNLPEAVPFRFIEADVCTADLERLFTGIDVVVHLAAITDAASSFNDREQVERVNYGGTERVARACLATGSRMIFLSTTSVYGTQSAIVDETCPLEDLKPQSPYAESKLRAEQLLTALGRSDGLPFIICRFGTIFGTSIGMRFHTAINKFVWQACLGQPLTVWRTAQDQERPYLDLEDGVHALRFIIDGQHFENQLYNVVTVNATVREIVNIIRQHVPNLEVQLVDERIMNQLSYEVRRKRFEALGFHFQGDLERSIAQMVLTLEGANRLHQRVAVA